MVAARTPKPERSGRSPEAVGEEDVGRARGSSPSKAGAPLETALVGQLWAISSESWTSGKVAGTASEPQSPMAKAFRR